jgi:arylsulfatase A-like enzyme
MAERGVRFVQVCHVGWDHHGNLPTQLAGQAKDVDQGAAALIQDLKQRGMLDDTLVIFGGEFGRTVYGQFGTNAVQEETSTKNYGRDHHPRCFTIWMAGGGIKPGITYGETDDFSYNITRDPVTIHDWHATILNRLGIDHTRLTYRHMGRDFRLTDVEGQVVKGILT